MNLVRLTFLCYVEQTLNQSTVNIMRSYIGMYHTVKVDSFLSWNPNMDPLLQ